MITLRSSNLEENFLIADAKPSPINNAIQDLPAPPEYEIISPEEVCAASLNDDEFDIRPRIYDSKNDMWVFRSLSPYSYGSSN